MRFTSRKCLYRNPGLRVAGLDRPGSRRSDRDDPAELVSDKGCFGREGLNTPMSAVGQQRTSSTMPIYVRYWGQTGHPMSAFSALTVWPI